MLAQRLANESQEQFGAVKTTKEVLAMTGPGGTANGSPMPRMSAYDLLLEINAHIPPKEKITLDVDKLSIEENKIEMSGTVKSPEEVDLLASELKKIDCFNKDVSRGPSETENGLRKFRFTITPQCQ